MQPILSGYQGPPGGMRLAMHGSEGLWVEAHEDRIVRGVPATRNSGVAPGGVHEKFRWVRLKEGRLTLEARRLDQPAPPALVSVPDGYGALGFQATGITFPTPGCWEITGRTADQLVRFVVTVRGATG